MRTGSHQLTGTLLAVAFVGGWLSASWVSPPAAVTQTVPRRPVVPPPTVAMPRVALDAVRAPDTSPAVARNPFLFGGDLARPRTTAALERARAVAPIAPVLDASAPPPDAPLADAPPVVEMPWSLVGLAATGDTVTTAVLSGRGDVLLVGVGDRLPDGAEVIALDAGRVTLRLTSGETRILDLP